LCWACSDEVMSLTPYGASATRSRGSIRPVDDETPLSSSSGLAKGVAGESGSLQKSLFGVSRGMKVGSIIWARSQSGAWWPGQIVVDECDKFQTEQDYFIKYFKPDVSVTGVAAEWVDRASRLLVFAVAPLANECSDEAHEEEPLTIALKNGSIQYEIDVSAVIDSIGVAELFLNEDHPKRALGLLIDRDLDCSKGDGKARVNRMQKAIRAALGAWCELSSAASSAVPAASDAPTANGALASKRNRLKVEHFVAESATKYNKSLSLQKIVASPVEALPSATTSPAAAKRPAGEPPRASGARLQGRSPKRVRREDAVQPTPRPAAAAAAAAPAVQRVPPLSHGMAMSALALLPTTRHPEFRDSDAPATRSHKFSELFASNSDMVDEESTGGNAEAMLLLLIRTAAAGTSPSALPNATDLNSIWRTLCSEDAPSISLELATRFVSTFRRVAYWATRDHRDIIGKSATDWEAYEAVLATAFSPVSVPAQPAAAAAATPLSPAFVAKFCARGILEVMLNVLDEFGEDHRLLQLLRGSTRGLGSAADYAVRKALSAFDKSRRKPSAFEPSVQALAVKLLRHVHAELKTAPEPVALSRMEEKCVYAAKSMSEADLRTFLEVLEESPFKRVLVAKLLSSSVPGASAGAKLKVSIERAFEPSIQFEGDGEIDRIVLLVYEAVKLAGAIADPSDRPRVTSLQLEEFIARYIVDTEEQLGKAEVRSKCLRMVASRFVDRGPAA